MFNVQFLILSVLLAHTAASFSGPYLLWGPQKLENLQMPALTEASNTYLPELFKESKAVIMFLRSRSHRIGSGNFPKLQQYIKTNSWLYLPQNSLEMEPSKYNTIVKVISLNGSMEHQDIEVVNNFKDSVSIYGEGKVLGVLADREIQAHFMSKREDVGIEKDQIKVTTTQLSLLEQGVKSKLYVADGKKATLFVNAGLVLSISNESLKLEEHYMTTTFDDQKSKGYGRLNIIFYINGEKLFLRFSFTLSGGLWTINTVEVEYKEYKNVLSVVGDTYDVPMAPLGFSYRCSSVPLIFTNNSERLIIFDYQIQPWLNGASHFGDVYDCVGFMTSAIWSGVLISFFLLGILSVSIIALMNIKTPNRFESSRSKQITFCVQD